MDPETETPSETPAPKRDPFPKLRPYQLPPSEAKAREERDAADRAERIRELQAETAANEAARGPAKKRHRIRNCLLWMLLIVFLTAAIGGSVYWFVLRKQPG